VTRQEITFLHDVMRRAITPDSLDRMEIKPDFSMGLVFELCARLQMYKQQAAARGTAQDDPLYDALHALTVVLRMGLYPSDAATLDATAIIPVLADLYGKEFSKELSLYYSRLREQITNSYDMTLRSVERTVTDAQMQEGYAGEDGIELAQRGDAIFAVNGDKAVTFTLDSFTKNPEQRISPTLMLARVGNAWVLRKDVIASVGDLRFAQDARADARALSPSDMPQQVFMSLSKPLRAMLGAMAEAGKPIIAKNGLRIAPRAMHLFGEAGTGKSSMPVTLCAMDGSMFVRLNPHRESTAQSISAEMSIKKEIEMNITEFLASVATVDGKRVTNKQGHSGRVRVMIDEANITQDAWYLLDAISRGEQDFYWLAPDGHRMHVVMEKHVELVLTYNPAERFGGLGEDASRFKLPEPISSRGMHLYVGDPLESYSAEEQRQLLDELFARGRNYEQREKVVKALGLDAAAAHDAVTDDDAFVVNEVPAVAVASLDTMRERLGGLRKPEAEKAKAKERSPEEDEKMRKELEKMFQYSDAETESLLARVAGENGVQAKGRLFVKDVLPVLVKGLALDGMSEKTFGRVVSELSTFDPTFAELFRKYRDVYASDELSLESLKQLALRIKAHAEEKYMLFLEQCTVLHVQFEGRSMIGLSYQAVPIKEIVNPPENRLAFLGDSFEKAFPERRIPRIVRLDRPMAGGVLGYYDGLDLVQVALDDPYESASVAWHELFHIVTDNIAKSSPDMRQVLRLNVETYAMLGPVIMHGDPTAYIRKELVDRIKHMSRNTDPYAVASIAILKAFGQKFGFDTEMIEYEKPVLSEVDALVAKIMKKSVADIRDAAHEMVHYPIRYFADMPQTYYEVMECSAMIGGKVQQFKLGAGLTVAPAVQVVNKGDAAEQTKESKEESGEVQGKKLLDDQERRKQLFEAGFGRELPKPVESIVRQFERLFAPEKPKSALLKKYVSEGGTEIDIAKYLEGDYDHLFLAPNTKNKRNEKAFDLIFVVDTSGSMGGYHEVVEQAFLHYAGLAARLGQKNKDLNVSLVSLSTRADVVISFDDWRKARSPDEKKSLIAKACDNLWAVGDGGGLDTPALLASLAQMKSLSSTAKDRYTQVVVLTDGQEGGGAGLQKMINTFVADRNVSSRVKQFYDMAYFGIGLSDQGAMLKGNYPAFANFGEDTTGTSYLRGLLQAAISLAKGKRLAGNLAEQSSDEALPRAEKIAQARQRTESVHQDRTSSSSLKGGIDLRGIAAGAVRTTTQPPLHWREGGIAVTAVSRSGNGDAFVRIAEAVMS